jgi:tetratricopeptide (TPR) repeat protein
VKKSILLALVLLCVCAPAAQAQTEEAADSAWRGGHVEAAERLYGEILRADSSNTDALHRMALLLAWKNQFQPSLALFAQLLRLRPDYTDARIDRARVLSWQGDTRGALAALDSLLVNDQENVAALQLRAQIESWAGSYDSALRTYDRLRQIAPEDASIAYDQARVLSWANRFVAAAQLYNSLLATNPNDVAALQGSARIQAWSGQLITAEAIWRRALGVEPNNATSLTGLAQTLAWQGRDAAAYEVLQQALAVAPGNKEARDQLRFVKLTMAPRIAPSYIVEHDSDGNTMNSARVWGAYRARPRTELRLDAYHRATSLDDIANGEQQAYGAGAGVLQQFEPGWSVSALAGLSAAQNTDATFGMVRLAATTPTRGRANANVSFTHGALDATSQLILKEVTTTDVALAANVALTTSTSFSAGASTTRFHSAVSGLTNRRKAASASLTRRMSRPVTLGLAARGFAFDEDYADGYFDPDFFATAELFGRFRLERNKWALNLEAAPGVQRILSDGALSGTARFQGRVTYGLGLNQSIEIFALTSNSGTNVLSQSVDDEYRYRALGISGLWVF